jgi:multiple sugar transport system permease protein
MSDISTTTLPTTKSDRVQRLRRFVRSDRFFWALLLWPALIILFVVFIYPLAYSIYLSLTSYNLITPPRFVGLQNYARILSDPQVHNSLRVSLIFTVFALALELGIGFGIALILHDLNVLRGFFRTATAIPLMMTPVVIGLVWRMMGNYDFGVFNYLLGLFGVEKVGWLLQGDLAMAYLIIADVWHTTGFVVLALSAGLAQLPQEMYEAAAMDGASYLQQLRHLTVPLLVPVFIVVIVFRLYNLIRMFDKSYTLTTGGPGHATSTMSITLIACAYFIWKM